MERATLATSVHLARAGLRLALLMRIVPLLQAVFTLTFGFAVYRRLWVGVVAGCLVSCWFGYLGMRAWRGVGAARDPWAVYLTDAAVAGSALVMLAAAVPPALLTTSFYWAAPDDTGMEEVADAIAAGALGYLTKHAPAEEYATAIRVVAAGRGYIGARLAAHVRRASRVLAVGSPHRLTDREEEVAALVVDGYTNSEIAQLLRLSERTVDGHLESIKRKIHETRRVRVAMRLKELGYRPPP